MSHHPAAAVDTDEQQQQQPQCRICLDGPDPDLGRLIRPCLCSGTVSVRQAFPTVPARTNPLTESLSLKHIRIVRAPRVPPALEEYVSQYLCIFCLSAMPLPLPLCPYQDSWPGYQPRFVLRPTHITPLHSTPALCVYRNLSHTVPVPVAIATLSTVLFTAIVYASSFLTTTLLSSLDDPSYYSFGSSAIYVASGGGYWTWTNPYTVGRDLVRAALRIIQDEAGGVFDPDALLTPLVPDNAETIPSHNIFWRFIRRLVLGLPVVGAASLVQMLFSLPLLGPIQWIARSRGNRGRRSNGSRDTAAVVIILLLAIGALR
jgi:hypothetical protein